MSFNPCEGGIHCMADLSPQSQITPPLNSGFPYSPDDVGCQGPANPSSGFPSSLPLPTFRATGLLAKRTDTALRREAGTALGVPSIFIAPKTVPTSTGVRGCRLAMSAPAVPPRRRKGPGPLKTPSGAGSYDYEGEGYDYDGYDAPPPMVSPIQTLFAL
jgi:hypothetical protein